MLFAAQHNFWKAAYFLDKEFDLEYNSFNSPLHRAILCKHVEMTELLLCETTSYSLSPGEQRWVDSQWEEFEAAKVEREAYYK